MSVPGLLKDGGGAKYLKPISGDALLLCVCVCVYTFLCEVYVCAHVCMGM